MYYQGKNQKRPRPTVLTGIFLQHKRMDKKFQPDGIELKYEVQLYWDKCKYSGEKLREIRKLKGVGRPPEFIKQHRPWIIRNG